jgi:hypothetical protein
MVKTKMIKTAPSIDIKTAINNRFPVGCLEDRNLKTLLNFAKACDALANLPVGEEFTPSTISVPARTILMGTGNIVKYERTDAIRTTKMYQCVTDPTDVIKVTRTTKKSIYKTVDTDYHAIAEYIRNYIKNAL